MKTSDADFGTKRSLMQQLIAPWSHVEQEDEVDAPVDDEQPLRPALPLHEGHLPPVHRAGAQGEEPIGKSNFLNYPQNVIKRSDDASTPLSQLPKENSTSRNECTYCVQ